MLPQPWQRQPSRSNCPSANRRRKRLEIPSHRNCIIVSLAALMIVFSNRRMSLKEA